MLKRIFFRNQEYILVITNHARERMTNRGVSEKVLISVIESGDVKARKENNKFWVYAHIKQRKDNLICVSVAVENPNIIVITTLVNWRPK